MSKVVWRLRMFARRAVPHTPAKRWAYGAAFLIVLIAIGLGRPWSAAFLLVLTVAARLTDLRRSSVRRGRLPTSRAYFFEGDDDPPAAPWRR